MLENLLYEDFTPMIIYFVFYMYTLSGFIVPKPPSFETVFCWTVSHFDTVRPSIFPTLRISENSLSIFALEFLVSGLSNYNMKLQSSQRAWHHTGKQYNKQNIGKIIDI